MEILELQNHHLVNKLDGWFRRLRKSLITVAGKFPGHELDRFMEKSSNRQFNNFGTWNRPISGKLIQNRAFSRKMIFKEFRGATKTDFWKTHPIMDEFPRCRSSSSPDILQKLGNWNFEKILDEFSGNRFRSYPGELKFRKNFWMSIPEFSNFPDYDRSIHTFKAWLWNLLE